MKRYTNGKNLHNVDGTSAKHQDYCDLATKYTTKSIVGTLIMTNRKQKQIMFHINMCKRNRKTKRKSSSSSCIHRETKKKH
jgi:hypothetical protein